MSVCTLSAGSEGEAFEQFSEDAGYMAMVPMRNSFTSAYTTTVPLQCRHNNYNNVTTILPLLQCYHNANTTTSAIFTGSKAI
jgi:hypothetical protein